MSLALAILVSFGVLASAEAQEKPATAKEAGQEDVVVIGRTGRERRREAGEFVRALSSIPGSVDPIARFDGAPLCPAAVGLSEAQNTAVTERMRRIAEAARISLADPGCRTNALLIVARDKNEMIAALRRKHPAYFLTEGKIMVDPGKQPGPATAWHLKGKVDRSGTPVSSEPGAIVSSPIPPSRISSAFRPIFLAAVVVVEREAVVGLTTTQLGDYAAMRAFSGADPAKLRKSQTPTILTVLDADPSALVPVTLTRWDLAYLRALYSGQENHYGPRQRTAMANRVASEIERDEEKSR